MTNTLAGPAAARLQAGNQSEQCWQEKEGHRRFTTTSRHMA
jgi:hypothetical protein